MEKKLYAILGLGVFGSSIAKKLSEYDCEVIAIDKDMANVERVSEFVTQAVQADFTDIEQLKTIGISDCDAAVVATGGSLETSIFGVMNLKELGIPYVLAKAKNKANMNILLRIGADRVVRPEKELGETIAKTLLSPNILDSLDIDEDYSICEIKPKQIWIGKTLKDLDLRRLNGINVIAIRNDPEEKLSFSPPADYEIKKTDQLLVILDVRLLEELEKTDE